jgi:hypothetical protein
MPTVRVDHEVFEGLKKLAEPFVDTPSSVIRRLLEEKGVLAKSTPTSSRIPQPIAEPASPAESGLTPQSIYEKYLLATLDRDFNGRAHKREVTLAVIEKMRSDGLINAADLELVATGETKAENTIAWGRNALKERGYLSKLSIRGIWELTPEGRRAAKPVVLMKGKKG